MKNEDTDKDESDLKPLIKPLANQYRTNDDTFLKHIKSFMHPFEEAMLSLPEGQLAEILALEIPASSSQNKAFAPQPLP